MLVIPPGPADHVQGDLHAPLTLVEYGDYECPHCARSQGSIQAAQRAFGSKLCYIFRHFPLRQIHPQAELAAEAAEAAGIQGRFWEMHEAIFAYQENLSPILLRQIAGALNLNLTRFNRHLAEQKFLKRVQADLEGGLKSGVHGTPSFFVNGEPYEEAWEPAELFIEELAARMPRSAGSGKYAPGLSTRY